MGANREVSTILSESSLAANTTTSFSTAVDLKRAIGLVLTIRCTYHASATAGATLYVYTSADGTNYDTKVYTQFNNEFAANTTKQYSRPIDEKPRYIKVKVKNTDGSYALATLTVIATVQELIIHP